MIVVRDVDEDNIEDVFRVCSHNRLDDPLQRQGMEIKRRWMLRMLEEHGTCTKVAYIDGRPVAQILFYPEEVAPFVPDPRDGAVFLRCAFNPFPEARGKGAASALMGSLIEDGRKGMPCLGGKQCSFIATEPFDTGIGLSLEDFYKKHGFIKAGREMYLEISGSYMPRKELKYRPLTEDRGRAVVFYDPDCEWGYPFAVRVRDLLHEVEPDLPVELFDKWERPEEFIRRAGEELIVNTRIIQSFWTDRDAFRREVEQAIRGQD
jgi:GNAT superfamily N-acetyltransferase